MKGKFMNYLIVRKKRFIRIVLVLALCSLIMIKASYCQQGISSDEQLSEWYLTLYQTKSFDQIPSAILFYTGSAIYEKKNTRDQFAFFIGNAMRQSIENLKNSYDLVDEKGTQRTKIFFLNALWWTNTKESKDLIAKAESDWISLDVLKTARWMMENNPPDILLAPVDSAPHLDLLWSHFFATGDSSGVKRIISVLNLLEEGSPEQMLIGGAARWSLASNAKNHAKVYEICKEEYKRSRGTTKKVLKEILEKVESER